MLSSSLNNNLEFNESKPAISVLFQTESTKEIRILMREGQVMKEHKAPYPIVVELFDGVLDFGVGGEIFNLKKGGILALDGNVPHDLTAKSDCIVRLSLSIQDKVSRVESVIK